MTEILSGENKIQNATPDNEVTVQSVEQEKVKEPVIPVSPDDFNGFTFSRVSHLDLFSGNNYDLEFLGQKIDVSNINLKKYRILLLYSFIKQNLKKKANILEISDREETELMTHFRYQYDFHRISNIKDLELEYSYGKSMNIIKLDEKNTTQDSSIDKFDLVFCTSGINNLTEDESALKNIFSNISSLVKPGGYSLLCLDVLDSGKQVWAHNLLYYVFTNAKYEVVNKNFYQKSGKIITDTDLLFIAGDYRNYPFQFSAGRKFSDKGRIFSYNILLKKKPLQISIRGEREVKESKNGTPVYFFHHLMKCGGSSIIISLGNWFFLKYDQLERSGDINFFMNHKYNVADMFGDLCLTGHFQYDGIFLHQRYPEILIHQEEFKIFTFVRDPLKIRISLYYYVKMNDGYENKQLSLKQSLMFESNFLASLFPCDEYNYKEVLDRYFFIGIVEKMQESMDILASILKRKRLIIPVSNTTEKDSQVSELNPEFLKQFKEKNKLDYLIYDYCLEKFNKSLAENKRHS